MNKFGVFIDNLILSTSVPNRKHALTEFKVRIADQATIRCPICGGLGHYRRECVTNRTIRKLCLGDRRRTWMWGRVCSNNAQEERRTFAQAFP